MSRGRETEKDIKLEREKREERDRELCTGRAHKDVGSPFSLSL